eukprot:2605696-Pleurochrysis_carterae.AAC.1
MLQGAPLRRAPQSAGAAILAYESPGSTSAAQSVPRTRAHGTRARIDARARAHGACTCSQGVLVHVRSDCVCSHARSLRCAASLRMRSGRERGLLGLRGRARARALEEGEREEGGACWREMLDRRGEAARKCGRGRCCWGRGSRRWLTRRRDGARRRRGTLASAEGKQEPEQVK